MVLGSVTNTIYFIGVNFLFVLLLYFTAKYFFKKALLTFVEGERNRGDIYYQKKNRGVQLFKRHIMIIVKEPTFLLNALLSMVVPLIIYVVMSFSGQFSLDLLRSEQVKPFIGLIYSGIIIFPAIVSNISSTAITREGQAFWQTKVLPISSQMNMRYRILTTLVINLTGTLLLGIIGYILLPVNLQMVLIGALFAVSTNLFLAVIDFTINVYRPLLNWSHPTAAVKNNMNVTMALGIRLVIGLILFGIYKIAGPWMTNYSLVLVVLSIIFLVLYLVNRYILYNKLVTRFNKIAA
jgi:ABC-2 type transport system permease protein